MDDAWCGGCAAAGRWWLCIGCTAGERVHVVRDGMGAWEGGREGGRGYAVWERHRERMRADILVVKDE